MAKKRRPSHAPWLALGIGIGAGLGVASVLGWQAYDRRRKAANEPEYPIVATEAAQAREPATPHGLVVVGDEIRIEDWSAWMRFAPHAIALALKDGSTTADDVLANTFRRIFPDHAWPPSPSTPTWQRMVASVGRVLERPFVPHLRVVKDRT